MKHVVLLSTFISPFRSGAEAMVEEVPRHLYGEYAFTIVAARLSRALPKSEFLDGFIPVHRVGLGCFLDKWLFPYLASRLVKKLKPDLVHANLESFAGVAMMRIKRRNLLIRTVLTNQNTYTNYRGIFETLPMIKTMHAYADQVTVLSNALRKRSADMGFSGVHLIPNGVNVHSVPKRKPVFGRIVFAGRLEHIKGIDILLRAFVELPPHAHLRIIGSGSLRKELQLQASMLKIADRVTFVGQLEHSKVLEELAEAEIFCGLSRSEAFGNVFVEALACDCAVVATNVDGIPDIITNDVNGLLVEPDNYTQAAEAMLKLLNDEELRNRLVAAGRKTVQRYEWSTIAQEYKKVYMELLS